jgi:hypothetical protein
MRLRDELRRSQPAEVAEAAIAHGRRRSWQASVAALLAELGRPAPALGHDLPLQLIRTHRKTG